MGQARRRRISAGKCIYCGVEGILSNEHVIPYGLGGNLELKNASCTDCARITSQLEQKLLRGHWWPYRQFLCLPSRRDQQMVPNLKIKLKRSDDSIVSAEIPMKSESVAMVFKLNPPTILSGIIDDRYPFAEEAYMKMLAPLPKVISVDGIPYDLASDEKIEIPINFDAGELTRFLAKVAHSYAISRRGINACKEYFLPPIILGASQGAMTYVGGISSPIIGPLLPGGGLHSLMDRINGKFLTVYIQLFRDSGDPPPIYEVVVGKLED